LGRLNFEAPIFGVLSMARLKALTRHIANQRQQEPGDFYEADASGAKLAKALGWAEDATLVQAVIAAATNTVRPRRQYRRRDMTANS
jgi:hypothetical protein